MPGLGGRGRPARSVAVARLGPMWYRVDGVKGGRGARAMMIGIVAIHFAASFVMPMASAMRFRKQQIVQAQSAHNAAQK